MIVILVAMVHAYNLGVVKYDYKILYNVAYILVIEVAFIFIFSSKGNCRCNFKYRVSHETLQFMNSFKCLLTYARLDI